MRSGISSTESRAGDLPASTRIISGSLPRWLTARQPSCKAFHETERTLLFRQQAYIDGAWCNADSGATFGVDNPATGEIIGNVPDMGAAGTQRAIDAANAALPAWSKMSAKARGAILRKVVRPDHGQR